MGLTGSAHTRHDVRRVVRQGEAGVTLIELVVSMAILALIGASIAGAFAIGFRTVGTGQSPAKLTGSNDVLAFEQQIGRDINRAVCLSAPSQTAIPTGGCLSSVSKPAGSTCGPAGTYLLCLAWYQGGSPTCHTVTFKQAAGQTNILRTDLNSTTQVTSETRISTGDYNVTATWSPAVTTTAPNGGLGTYKWTRSVIIGLTQQGSRIASPIAVANFDLTPLAADPLSPAVPGGSIPC